MLSHLPSFRATPLLLLLLLLGCLGVALGGSLHKGSGHHGRGRTPTTPDEESGQQAPPQHHQHHRKDEGRETDTTPLAVTIAQSQQRALFKNGKRLGDEQVPDALSTQHRVVRHNGTVVQQQPQQHQQRQQQLQRRRTRVVKRQASATSCEIREEVVYYHQGECVTIAGLDFCETDLYLDLGNADCT